MVKFWPDELSQSKDGVLLLALFALWKCSILTFPMQIQDKMKHRKRWFSLKCSTGQWLGNGKWENKCGHDRVEIRPPRRAPPLIFRWQDFLIRGEAVLNFVNIHLLVSHCRTFFWGKRLYVNGLESLTLMTCHLEIYSLNSEVPSHGYQCGTMGKKNLKSVLGLGHGTCDVLPERKHLTEGQKESLLVHEIF